MDEVELTLVRSCNAQGVLYGSVTQRDIADALVTVNFEGVDTRAVRLQQAIRRIGEYQVTIQFDKDLRAEISIEVLPDRTLEELDDEMEFDDEGELIEKPRKKAAERAPEPEGDDGQDDAAPAEAGTEEPSATNDA